MNLESGIRVVHKTHGVGEICGVETKNYGAGPQDYYLLRILSSGLVVRFPKNFRSTVVRNLASEQDIIEIYSILKSPPKNYSMVWNRRKKEFNEKIKSGSLIEIAEVIRDLSSRKSVKDLSFGEKEMLEKARERIVNEVCVVKSMSVEDVNQELDSLLRVGTAF